MNKKFVALITLISILMSVFTAVPGAFAEEEVTVTTVYDLTGKDFEITGSSTWKYPVIPDGENTVSANAFYMRNRFSGNVTCDTIGSDAVIKYNGVPADTSSADTYINFYANNEQTSIDSGRLVYTGKFYTNTDTCKGTFKVGGTTYPLWSANTLKTDTRYDLKYVVDLERNYNNVIFTLTEKDAKAPAVHKSLTYTGDTYTSTRFDFDVPHGETGSFTAYADLKLTYTTGKIDVSSSLNDNASPETFGDGIFTAETDGSGIFAVALYDESGDLDSLRVVNNEYELESVRLNMAIENADGKILKLFRFEADGTPFMVNKELSYDEINNLRIYAMEDFSKNPALYPEVNGKTLKITDDDTLEFTANKAAGGVDENPRWGISAFQHGRYFIYEADYKLGTATLNGDASEWEAKLIANNYKTKQGGNNINPIIDMVGSNIRNRKMKTDGTHFDTIGELSTDEFTKISLKIDTLNDTCEIYLNRELIGTGSNVFQVDKIAENSLKDGIGFMIGHASGDGDDAVNLIVDNVNIYEGTEFKDLTGLKPNVHVTDFPDDKVNDTPYKRPSAVTIADKTLNSAHPRVMLTPKKVNDIKTSSDENVIKWREELIKRADSAITEEVYKYTMNGERSMRDYPEGIERVMDLGLAYLLTGNTKYSDRAYTEAEVLMNYKRVYETTVGSAAFDDWNSHSYLDVGEGSFFMAICYDWMYDAWTDEQKKAMTDAVMQRSIDMTYKILHDEELESDIGKTDKSKTGRGWYDSTNNWGSVCNGGVFTACIAFMDEAPFKCATVAESAIRNVEYMMSSYAPDGAWGEGPSYWGYALKYLAAMLSTMEASLGGVYGIDKAEGFSNTGLYSLALEGKSGVAGFGDTNGNHVKSPAVFYLSKLFNKPEYTAANLDAMVRFGFDSNAFDLVYYEPEMNNAEYKVPTAFYYEGAEVVTFSSDNSFIAISGGTSKGVSHDHLDSGGVIIDSKGERLFTEIGAEHYDAVGYFGESRYKYFKARPEGHNIFVINPEADASYDGQDKEAFSYIEKATYDADNHKATMNLTDAYARDASEAKREIALEGDDIIITDTIKLKNPTNDIYWNWYVKVRVFDDDDNLVEFGKIEISEDGKSAAISLKNKEKHIVSFETDCDYVLSVEEAETDGKSNQYIDTETPLGNNKRHEGSRLQRLTVKMADCPKSEVTLKTIIK